MGKLVGSPDHWPCPEEKGRESHQKDEGEPSQKKRKTAQILHHERAKIYKFKLLCAVACLCCRQM